MTATLTVLGSGTLVPDHERHAASFAVEEGDAVLLFDCGSGVLDGLSRFEIPWRDITHVVLSHFHTDHIGGLAPLLFALSYGVEPARTLPLTVLGPPGLNRLMAALSEAYGRYVLEPGFELDVIEIERNGRWSDGRVDLCTCETVHTDHSVAYRWQGGSGVIGYTGDTGESPILGRFLAGADVLVVECAFPDPSPVEGHLSPRGVAALARAVSPELVVTTHTYPTLPWASVPELVREAGYEGRVVAGYDGLRVTLEEGVPPLPR